jgi:uncharacterized coiled-coil protein SlyX
MATLGRWCPQRVLRTISNLWTRPVNRFWHSNRSPSIKRKLDSNGTPQFGLVAEQVEKIDPHLVARDAEGKPYTVRYDAVNAMVLNESLKEHRKVEDQEATIRQLSSTVAQQQKDFQATAAQIIRRLDEQASQIQKVNAQ